MSKPIVLAQGPLGFPWKTFDPFLFCAHHLDHYPRGDAEMEPVADLSGRALGSDFSGKDGFSMYHGLRHPGFPSHPHRGFETVTLVRRGYVDHSDSLGATARLGNGDVQWITAGAGLVHSEMFPLVHEEQGNPTELFQIWLNLPAKSKMVPPYFQMYWGPEVPRAELSDPEGRKTQLTLVAGEYPGLKRVEPPPDSWAHEPSHGVEILSLKLEAGAKFRLPKAPPQVQRTLYFFAGSQIRLQRLDCESAPAGTSGADYPACHSQTAQVGHYLRLNPDTELELTALDQDAELLLLGGQAIGEPVAAHGPFVMNTVAELQQTFRDFQRTGFGGWPWKSQGPVHPRARGRFAHYPDGREEEAPIDPA